MPAISPARSVVTPFRSEAEGRQLVFCRYLEKILSGEQPLAFHFQPIADLCRGTVAGYEALVRFPEEMGPAPDTCIAMSARYGKQADLEGVITRTALTAKALLPPDCFLSINISPSYLLSDQLAEVLASTSDLAGIVIEITEEASIDDYDAVRVRLAEIRARGGSIAVDDAGSGYASLKHIIEVRPDFIKLDRSFVRNCHVERAKSTLIEMIGRTANRMDSWIIAEGVETEAELDELIRLGVPLGQGYYLGRPAMTMNALAPEKGCAIRERIRFERAGQSLQRYAELCPVALNYTQAEDLLHADLSTDTAVVVDQWGRPVDIIERHPALHLRCLPELMKVQLSSDLNDVLHRALARPSLCRFDPLALINMQGEFAGVVHIDRLMRAVLSSQ